MENVNGVYRVACSVNGAKMKMIFDTGASAVCLSESMANYLYDTYNIDVTHWLLDDKIIVDLKQIDNL